MNETAFLHWIPIVLSIVSGIVAVVVTAITLTWKFGAMLNKFKDSVTLQLTAMHNAFTTQLYAAIDSTNEKHTMGERRCAAAILEAQVKFVSKPSFERVINETNEARAEMKRDLMGAIQNVSEDVKQLSGTLHNKPNR